MLDRLASNAYWEDWNRRKTEAERNGDKDALFILNKELQTVTQKDIEKWYRLRFKS